jgi:hypothetical protein
MLKTSFVRGYAAAFRKMALSPPTQVDDFLAHVESGKDMPIDPSSSINGAPMAPPAQPPPPVGLDDFMSRGQPPQPPQGMP